MGAARSRSGRNCPPAAATLPPNERPASVTASPRADGQIHRRVQHAQQFLSGEGAQGIRGPVGQAVAGQARHKDVVALVEKLLAQLTVLIGAGGETVEQDDGARRLLPVGEHEGQALLVQVAPSLFGGHQGIEASHGVSIAGRRVAGRGDRDWLERGHSRRPESIDSQVDAPNEDDYGQDDERR